MADETKVEISINGKIPQGAVVIEGFQGVGLVGSIAAQYISDKKKATSLGYLSYEGMPSIAVLINGEMKYPIRVYSFKSRQQEFIVFESELPIPPKFVHDVAQSIVDFAKKNRAKEIVCLEGLAVPNALQASKVFGFSTGRIKSKRFSDNVELLQNGIVIGVSAALMMQAKLMSLSAFCFIAEAHSEFPDGLAAAGIIKKLNSIYGLDVDTNELEKESKKFEDKLVNIIQKAHDVTAIKESPKKTYIG